MRLGQAGATGENQPEITKGQPGEYRDNPDDMPVLLDEGFVNTQISGNKLDQFLVRGRAQTSHTFHRNRSCARRGP